MLFLGDNGAGKSTLLKVLGSMYATERGVLTETTSLARAYYAPSFMIYDELSVEEHFSFFSSMLNENFSTNALSQFELEKMSSKKAGTLSRGWRARLGLGLAFARNVDLLLLDEPLAELDQKGRELCLQALDAFHQEPSCVSCIATHRPELFSENTQRVTLSHGVLS